MLWIRILRLPNLFLVIVTQYLVRFAVLRPAFGNADPSVPFTLSEGEFALLVFITALVTVSGYLVNDRYDFRIDAINKPERAYVGVKVSGRTLTGIYVFLLVPGLLFSTLLAVRLGYLKWLWIYPASVGALWLYSARLKRTPLSGNILVSLFTAGVALVVWLAEYPSFETLYVERPDTAQLLSRTFIFYAAFAFLSNLFREIVKDMEDVEGDRSDGCRTLPIAAGMPATRAVAALVLTGLVASLFWFVVRPPLFENPWVTAYAALLLFAPLVVAGYGLFRARTPAHFRRLSSGTKWIMAFGLLFLPVIFLT